MTAPSRAPEDSSPLVLLDGYSLAYRAFFALPPELATSTGQTTNAVYGFTAMLVKLFGDIAPDRLAVCFDAGRPQYRHDRYEGYKATRAQLPDDLRTQLGLIREVLAALQIPAVELEGYEADDVIATLARQATEAGIPVLVVTGDRDLLQLVDDRAHVRVMLTRRGMTDARIYDEDAVRERYGVGPSRYPDLAALRGDPSDNLPGVPGVGDKTAARLVQVYGDVEDVLAHASEERPRLRASLTEHAEAVRRNKDLSVLLRDVPITCAAGDLAVGPWDRAVIHHLFDTLEFQTLRERLFATVEVAGPSRQGFVEDTRIAQPGDLARWLEGAGTAEVAIAADMDAWPGGARLRACAFTRSGSPTLTAAMDVLDHDDRIALGTWCGALDRPKVTHDAKTLVLAVREEGWALAGLRMDTALAAYLAQPAQRGYRLEDVTLRYLQQELRAETARLGSGLQASMDGAGDTSGQTAGAESAGAASLGTQAKPQQLTLDSATDSSAWRDDATAEERALAELGLRAVATEALARALDEELGRIGMRQLLAEVELPLTTVLAKLEATGVAIDVRVLSEIAARLDARLRGHEEQVWKLAGEQFVIGSNPQLQQVLFTKLGLPKTKRIKTGYTTDAAALAGLRMAHPIVEEILGYREVAKLKSTYVDALPKLVSTSTGRIHAQFNQMSTATGRLSSNNPNVQNIPTRTDAGREVRRAFVAEAGYEGLLVADYAQIEFRVLAHLTQDDALIEAFKAGEDVHATVASMVWGLAPSDVGRDLRNRVKAVTYGLAYGQSAFGLAQSLGVSPEEARDLMTAYFDRFGAVRSYLEDVVAQARHDGYTQTLLGRRRYLPDLVSTSFQRRQMAERMALNAPIQGSAADVIKLAMLAVDSALREEQLASRMILQVHDELVFEVAAGEGQQLAELVRRCMEAVYPLRVPLSVSMASGASWAQAQH